MMVYQIWKIAQADLRERTRRFSFLFIAALSVLAAFWAVPRPAAEFTSITIDTASFSQGTTWSWIPMAAALCMGVLLPLIGFFYIKNTLSFDRETGTVNLIFTSPVSKFTYFAGKYISNLWLLFSVLLIVAASSLFMAFVHFQNARFSIFHFLSFFVSAIPGLFFCAAIALLFEAIPLFQTKMGTGLAGFVYLIIYIICLNFALASPQGVIARFFDITGFTWLKNCVDRSVYPVTGKPAEIALFVGGSANINDHSLPALAFGHLSFAPQLLPEKIFLVIMGLILCATAAMILPRRERKQARKKAKSNRNGKAKILGNIATEFILTFRECSLLWFLVMAVLWFSLLMAPLVTAQKTLWPLAIAWSLVLFSDYGCREKKCYMRSVIGAVSRAYPNQLIARWFAGSITALFITAPVILRTFLFGEITNMLPGIVFAIFIPALSIFLGTISGSERLFEIVFLIICYVMLNSTSLVLSLTAGETSALRCGCFAAAAMLMIVVSYFMRRIRH